VYSRIVASRVSGDLTGNPEPSPRQNGTAGGQGSAAVKLPNVPVTTVCIRDPQGRKYATNVEAESIEAAVEKAVAFFNDPFWKGPKPKSGMVLQVSPQGGEDRRNGHKRENSVNGHAQSGTGPEPKLQLWDLTRSSERLYTYDTFMRLHCLIAFVLIATYAGLARAADDQQAIITNDAVIKLVKAGLSDDVIVSFINTSPGSYDASPNAVIALKNAGTSDRIVSAVIAKASASGRSVQSASPAPVSGAELSHALVAASGDVSSETAVNSISGRPKPRVFLQSASKGTNRNAARDQSMEMSKDLEKDCQGVRITVNPQMADYTILLNHIEVGAFIRDNQIQIANREGDLLSKTKEGGSIAGGMKKACAMILADWEKK
jgi:hypothetical protein